MNLYETQIRLYNSKGFVPVTRDGGQIRNIKASSLRGAARHAMNDALKLAKGKRIKSFNLTVRWLARISAPAGSGET